MAPSSAALRMPLGIAPTSVIALGVFFCFFSEQTVLILLVCRVGGWSGARLCWFLSLCGTDGWLFTPPPRVQLARFAACRGECAVCICSRSPRRSGRFFPCLRTSPTSSSLSPLSLTHSLSRKKNRFFEFSFISSVFCCGSFRKYFCCI